MKKLVLIMTVAAVAGVASADLAGYSQNFEGMEVAVDGSTALTDDGWLAFANVFGPDWAYWYGYGPFGAPNNSGGPAFSNVVTGEGGVDQGDRQLVVFSDYNNGDHGNGAYIESNVFQEQTVGAADVGSLVTFTFDAKLGNLEAPTTALAFIKTLDPGAGYAMTNFETVETTAIPTAWGTYSIDLFIDASLEGQILQFGFSNTATGYNASGVIYDNATFVIPEPATLGLLGLAGAGLFIRRRILG